MDLEAEEIDLGEVYCGEEKLYDAEDLAEMLKITKPTIRLYLREAKIKGGKVDGKWYITEDDLEDYLRRGNK